MALALGALSGLAAAVAAALVSTGCWTELDLNLGGSGGQTDIPSLTESYSIGRPALRGRVESGGPDGTVFSFALPATIDACAAGPEPEACADSDGDGLIDLFEDAALDALRPIVRVSADDPLFQDRSAVGALGRVMSGPAGAIRVIIILAYSRDYGSCTFTQHRGDPERIAVELHPLPRDGAPPRWLVTGIYTAAHEGTSRDGSWMLRAPDLTLPDLIPDAQGVRWVVHASGGKHGTYATRALCAAHSSLPCVAEHCPGNDAVELLFPVLNAGEPDTAPDPLERIARQASPGFDFLVFAGERAWVEQPFCGGLGGSPCSGSLREKLLDDPFASVAP